MPFTPLISTPKQMTDRYRNEAINPLVPVALVVFASLLFALVLSGCGQSNSSNAKAGPSGAPEEFGLTLQQLASRVETTEQRVAVCMQKAGFTYVPLDFATIKTAMSIDKSAPGLSTEEYVKQFGLGITTQFDKPIVTFGAGETNNTYLTSLPELDQIAFRRSLWGETPEWNHVRALEEEDFSQTGGCTRTSAEQTYKPNELAGTYINSADELLQQDPRVIDATKKWAQCMRADGFEYDNPNQVDEDLYQRLAAITQGQDPKTLTGPTLEALTDLQGQERAIATLLVTCEEQHLEPVVAKVEAELYGKHQKANQLRLVFTTFLTRP